MAQWVSAGRDRPLAISESSDQPDDPNYHPRNAARLREIQERLGRWASGPIGQPTPEISEEDALCICEAIHELLGIGARDRSRLRTLEQVVAETAIAYREAEGKFATGAKVGPLDALVREAIRTIDPEALRGAGEPKRRLRSSLGVVATDYVRLRRGRGRVVLEDPLLRVAKGEVVQVDDCPKDRHEAIEIVASLHGFRSPGACAKALHEWKGIASEEELVADQFLEELDLPWKGDFDL